MKKNKGEKSREKEINVPLRASGFCKLGKLVGNVIYLIPYHNPWQVMFDSLDEFSADFMEEHLQPNQQARESFD